MQSTFPLTKSGIGIRIENPDESFFSTNNIKTLLKQYQFVVFNKLNWSVNNLQQFLENFGELVRNEKRENDTMLTLDGKRIATEVIRGNGRLPLHRDGLLMNTVVKYVAILCLENKVTAGGRTYISDSGAAWKNEFPEEIKKVLTENGVEGKPEDVTYYLKNEDKWYPFPGILEHNGKIYPNGGLHYHEGERSSYGVRIAKISKELSDKYFNEMEKILEDDQYTYFHDWQTGDVILFDNRTVLHGREAFEGDRSLIQMQVKE